jgi:hypothetical protein
MGHHTKIFLLNLMYTTERLQQLCLCVIDDHIPVRHDDLPNGPF